MASYKTSMSRLGPLTNFISNFRLSRGAIGSLLPKIAKFLICLLFLLNIRSWPLMWHFRLFRPAVVLRLQHRWVSICSMFKSASRKLKMEDNWFDSISPVGEHPFKKVVPYSTWASLDDCDFNGHLSNSSYAKTLDYARFKTALEVFPIFFQAGGWMPLAATHYHFIREIPMLASYQVRTSIAAWDQKWLYVMSKFVCKTNGKECTTKKPATPGAQVSSSLIMALRTSGIEPISSTDTPSQIGTPGDFCFSPIDTENALKAVSADLIGEEPDGARLHTIVISQLCFKVGRITVPPGLALAVNGFTGASGHSLAHPHPEWADAKRTMSRPFGGSPKKLKELMVGGWRDIPESERWWDKSLGERVEAQRVKNISMIEGLRKGLEKARTLIND